MGKRLIGIYHLIDNSIRIYNKDDKLDHSKCIKDIASDEAKNLLKDNYVPIIEEIELIRGVYEKFNKEKYLAGSQTPVFFGTALHNFGILEFLNCLTDYAPSPQPRVTKERKIEPNENSLSGFIFKIQANMDPAHRDRVAFLRICSGKYTKGMKIRHVRLQRDLQISNALTFMAGNREQADEAWAGDVIGLHNHGTIQVGDTFTQGEKLTFSGIPYFAPELFKIVRLKDPLKFKALQKGLIQLGEEGATQVFKPLISNDLILGAIGVLQFDVVAWRLKEEYGVDCTYENTSISTVRWVNCEDEKVLEEFKKKNSTNLALDGGCLLYTSPSPRD